MADSQQWTIGRLLQWTTAYLKQHGSLNARLDAEVLLAHACRCERIELYTRFNEQTDPTTRDVFRELVQRRASGTPVAYLVGCREFYSLSFSVTPDLLIPRPETELLVVTLLDLVRRDSAGSDHTLRIADVGTGSGILAVCAARHIPNCQVVATDISEAALKVARQNVTQYGVQQRVQLVLGDLLDELPIECKFDYIISNPPYVRESEFAQLAVDVREHEPYVALVAGPSGTEVIARLIDQAGQRLHPAGWLLMEISPMIQPAVDRLLGDSSQFASWHFHKDLAGLVRVVAAQRTADACPGNGAAIS